MAPDLAPRDIFLAPDLSTETAAAFLEGYHLREGAAADAHLQQLAEDLTCRLALANLADMLLDALSTTPDPDAALLGFCRYVAERTPRAAFIGNLQADPRMLDILTQLLGTSPFLSEILIRDPEYLHWLRRELDGPPPDRTAYDAEVDRRLDATPERRQPGERAQAPPAAGDAAHRRPRRVRDAGPRDADDDHDPALAPGGRPRGRRAARGDCRAHRPARSAAGRFAVIGMGKLGGVDLNYSSDIDLIYVYDVPPEAAGDVHQRYQRLGRRLTTLLSEHTAEGYLYRVDMRLRPMGGAATSSTRCGSRRSTTRTSARRSSGSRCSRRGR